MKAVLLLPILLALFDGVVATFGHRGKSTSRVKCYKGKCSPSSPPNQPNYEAPAHCKCHHLPRVPVCGGGRTFANKCFAECSGFQGPICVNGLCNPQARYEMDGCNCPRDAMPVCANGVTYLNGCVAACKGIPRTLHQNGVCRDYVINDRQFPPGQYPPGFPFYQSSPSTGASCQGPNCPYPVSPFPGMSNSCNCPVSYNPVCFNGRTFPNSCEASCAGAQVGQTTPGQCQSSGSCSCLRNIYNPVCANGVTYNSFCHASCARVDASQVTMGACGEARSIGTPITSPSAGFIPISMTPGMTPINPLMPPTAPSINVPVTPSCNCPTEYKPVCAPGGLTCDNLCQAQCRGFVADRVTQGACTAPSTSVPTTVITVPNTGACDSNYAPVCGANNVTYVNECLARSTGQTQVSTGVCRASDNGTMTQVTPITFPTIPATCSCNDNEWNPVCANGITYPSICRAQCAGLTATQVTQGACPVTPSTPRTCACPTTWSPGCVDGRTFSNYCEAQCMGANVNNVVTGVCSNSTVINRDTMPSMTVVSTCSSCFSPVCIRGQTFQNPCFAQLQGAPLAEAQWGTCHGRTASQCGCSRTFSPVCIDGRTYRNGCIAQCKGASLARATAGRCGLSESQSRTIVIDNNNQTALNCNCPTNWEPVCVNGTTWWNKCRATCSGLDASSAVAGMCSSPATPTTTTLTTTTPTMTSNTTCNCGMDWNPVCANGATYINSCRAQCAGLDVSRASTGVCAVNTTTTATNGTVSSSCSCPVFWNPVCFDSRSTYSNQCQAQCAGVDMTKVVPGMCASSRSINSTISSGCSCPNIYQPVCANGTSFSSMCHATCAGADPNSAQNGACPYGITSLPNQQKKSDATSLAVSAWLVVASALFFSF